MSVATSTAIGIAGALGAGGAITSGILGSNAATHAADTQANAANQAAQLQYQQSQDALNFQKQVYGQQQQNIAPWLQSGTGALASLDTLLGIPVSGFDPKSSFAYNLAQNPGGGLVNPTLQYDYPNSPAFSGNTQPGTQQQPQQFSTMPAQLQVPNPTNTASKALYNGPAINTFGGAPTSDMVHAFTGAGPTSGTAGLPIPAGGMQQQPAGTPAAGAPTSGIQGAIGLNRGAAAAGQPVSMSNLLGGSPTPGGLLQGWNQQFQAPTNVTEQNDPGYQFRLNQGMQALQNSAAARGGLLSGNTAQALNNYAQDYASNEYGNVYNRALGQYQQDYNIFNNNQQNQFNRLAALSGLGQTSAGQLNSAGSQAAGNVGNILLNSGQQIGNAMQNAGAATASGYVGSANALGGALQGATGSLGQYLTLNSLLGSGGQGGNFGGQVDPINGNYFNPYGS